VLLAGREAEAENSMKQKPGLSQTTSAKMEQGQEEDEGAGRKEDEGSDMSEQHTTYVWG